jgi:hypothetical protein
LKRSFVGAIDVQNLVKVTDCLIVVVLIMVQPTPLGEDTDTAGELDESVLDNSASLREVACLSELFNIPFEGSFILTAGAFLAPSK